MWFVVMIFAVAAVFEYEGSAPVWMIGGTVVGAIAVAVIAWRRSKGGVAPSEANHNMFT